MNVTGNMAKEDVVKMLNGMLEEVAQSNGFITGFLTKSSVIHMIERRIEEVEKLEEEP